MSSCSPHNVLSNYVKGPISTPAPPAVFIILLYFTGYPGKTEKPHCLFVRTFTPQLKQDIRIKQFIMPNAVDELINMIDEHLATELARPSSPASFASRASRGTMFVDYDACGNISVSYRHHADEYGQTRPATPPLAVIDSTMSVRHQPGSSGEARNGMWVEGTDPDTQFEYDYNGSVFHIHRDGQRTSSAYSEYYAIDALRYAGDQTELRVVDDELSTTSSERKKRQVVVGFIRKLLKKLDGVGILKKLKQDRAGRLHARPHMSTPRSLNKKSVDLNRPLPPLPPMLNWCAAAPDAASWPIDLDPRFRTGPNRLARTCSHRHQSPACVALG